MSMRQLAVKVGPADNMVDTFVLDLEAELQPQGPQLHQACEAVLLPRPAVNTFIRVIDSLDGGTYDVGFRFTQPYLDDATEDTIRRDTLVLATGLLQLAQELKDKGPLGL